MTVIITKNSATASAVPTASDLVQGELAVNVADKRLFTENASAQVIELGTNPTSLTSATVTVSANLNATGTLSASNAVISGGSINGSVIGGSSPLAITGTTITANTGFVGGLTGNVQGNLVGNTSGGTHTGPVVGDLTGNVSASSGTTSLHNLALTGTVDFNTARLTDIGEPVAGTDAATRNFVVTSINNLIDGAPASLDTLNELAAALNDDASFHSTVTTSLAGKLPLAGGTMTGAIAMGTNKISGLGDPTSAQDAATRAYVLTQTASGLPLSGGTMTGDIVLGSNAITTTADPASNDTLTRKSYVDGILGSATSAATSATNAASSASTSTSQAGISTTKAGESASSATAAAGSAASAASALDTFTDQYQGAQSSDPATDPDGDAQVAGNLVFNTTSNQMKVYTGSSWAAVAPTATSVTLSQISDLNANLDAFLATPSSANLITAVSDETGTGTLVFNTSPSLTTPKITTALQDSAGNSVIPFDANQFFSGTFSDKVTALGNTGSAKTIDLNDGNVFTATLNDNATLTLATPNAVSNRASSFTLILTNDGTPSRSVTLAGGTFKYPGGSISRTTAANKTDIWFFFTPDGGTTYYVTLPAKDLS